MIIRPTGDAIINPGGIRSEEIERTIDVDVDVELAPKSKKNFLGIRISRQNMYQFLDPCDIFILLSWTSRT